MARGVTKVKIKDDVLEKFEKGDTIYDIAEEYNTTVVAVLELLGLDENPWHYD